MLVATRQAQAGQVQGAPLGDLEAARVTGWIAQAQPSESPMAAAMSAPTTAV